jgi:tripartite-type tricarboxylate transporter receptor subunit TctC
MKNDRSFRMKGRRVKMRRGNLWICIFCLVIFSIAWGSNRAWGKYPERKIKFVVPMAPGGGADLLARALAKYVNVYLDGKVYVENITGGGGAIGFREGGKATPDGYTLTMLVTTITIAPHVIKDYPTYEIYDPICILAQDPMLITVPTESQFKTIQDLIAFAKANPGKLTAAISGIGGPSHLGMAAFGDRIGTQFTYVPYKGSAPALTAAAGKHVDIGTSTCSEATALVQGKKLRPLLVLESKRSRLFPDVPTSHEINHPVVINFWRGIAVPKGTPKEVKAVLVDAFHKAMEDEECKKLFEQVGLERVYLGPEEAGPWIKNQNDFFKLIATKVGLQPQ